MSVVPTKPYRPVSVLLRYCTRIGLPNRELTTVIRNGRVSRLRHGAQDDLDGRTDVGDFFVLPGRSIRNSAPIPTTGW